VVLGSGKRLEGIEETHFDWHFWCLASYNNYILLRTAAIHYLLLHTLTHLDRLRDCESFRAGQENFREGRWNRDLRHF
jgi:hypothetical protein